MYMRLCNVVAPEHEEQQVKLRLIAKLDNLTCITFMEVGGSRTRSVLLKLLSILYL